MLHDNKVNFVVAGAQKSGTRALRHFLGRHPEIGLSQELETHFFDEVYDEDAPQSYERYHALFPEDALGKVTGDITPIYMYLSEIPARLHAYNPDMKIVVILRNPIERAYSQWVMQRRKGQESGRFLLTILAEPLRFLLRGQDKIYSHVARGLYARQLRRLFKLFPREQVLILRNEDLRDAHEETLQKLFGFLDVSAHEVPAPKFVHTQEYKPMPPLQRWLLRQLFRRDTARLERMTGWDLSHWR